MPHIVIEKSVNAKEVHSHYTPIMERKEGMILKTTDAFINKEENSLLIDSVVIEGKTKQAFFIHINQKANNLTVRLLPATDPEKSNGVKTLMGLVAGQIKALNPNACYGKTNLEGFLIETNEVNN